MDVDVNVAEEKAAHAWTSASGDSKGEAENGPIAGSDGSSAVWGADDGRACVPLFSTGLPRLGGALHFARGSSEVTCCGCRQKKADQHRGEALHEQP